MALNVGQLNIGISVNMQQLQRSINTAQQHLRRFNTSVSNVTSNMSSGLQNTIGNVQNRFSNLGSSLQDANKSIGEVATSVTKMNTALMLTVSLPLAKLGKSFLEMAMNAEEANSKFNTVFKDLSDEANNFATSLTDNLGVSTQEAKQMMTDFYSIIKSMDFNTNDAYELSKAFTQLAYDMSSMDNLSVEDAFTKLKAGIVGSTEPLTSIGIVTTENAYKQALLAEGIKVTSGNLTEQQKVLARYITIVRASEDRIGDLARTNDSATNQLRAFKSQLQSIGTEIGSMMLPAFSNLLSVANELIGKWYNLSDATKETILKVGMVAVAVPIATVAIAGLTMVMKNLLSPAGLVTASLMYMGYQFIDTGMQAGLSAEEMYQGFSRGIKKSLEVFNILKSGVKIAMLEVQEWLYKAIKMATNVQIKLEETAYAITNFISGTDYSVDPKWYGYLDEYEQKIKGIQTSQESYSQSMKNSTLNLMRLGMESEKAKEKLNGLDEAQGDGLLDTIAKKVQGDINGLKDSIVGGMFDQYASSTDEATQQLKETESAVDSITSSILNLNKSLKNGIDMFSRFTYRATSSSKLLRNARLREQAMLERESILGNLANRGVSGDLLADLYNTDISKLGDLKGLNNMTDAQLAEWIKYTTSANNSAFNQASVTVQNANITVSGQEKNAERIAKEIYAQLKKIGG